MNVSNGACRGCQQGLTSMLKLVVFEKVNKNAQNKIFELGAKKFPFTLFGLTFYRGSNITAFMSRSNFHM